MSSTLKRRKVDARAVGHLHTRTKEQIGLSRKTEQERRKLRSKHLGDTYEECEEEGDRNCSHTVKKKITNAHRKEGWKIFWKEGLIR